jgi:biopolymer transport protein ExbB
VLKWNFEISRLVAKAPLQNIGEWYMQNEFLSLMGKGGPIMWVIFVTACIAMIMLVWQSFRVLQLMQYARRDYEKLQIGHDFVPGTDNPGGASPVAQLFARINWVEVNSKEDVAREMNIQVAGLLPKLEGGLPTIATLGSLLPMLGLLGTVMGMINVFEVIALHGSGKPEQMADGISQALLTTASGLIIAIPVIFLHHLLSRRVNVLMVITGQAMQIILHRDFTLYKKAKKL